MISLFHIPNYIIDTSQFSNLLNDKIVSDFENNFAEFVGCKYAISTNSASTAIFLLLKNKKIIINIPTIIPPVVPNAIINAGNQINFTDNIDWVGNSYILHQFHSHKIIDSAQKVKPNQFKTEANDHDLMIFSFYPTKPVGGCDGGMICTNDIDKASYLRILINNGTTQHTNSWNRKCIAIGYKAYMNSIQAFIANENLKILPLKLEKLAETRHQYNKAFNLTNTSDHLYRVNVKNRRSAIDILKNANISTGIHYHCCHNEPIYQSTDLLPKSEKESQETLSIPFHDHLTKDEISHIIKTVTPLL